MLRKPLALLTLLFVVRVVDARAQTADDLFNEDILHEVRLDMRPADWQYLKDHFEEDTYVVCNLKWKLQDRDVEAPQIGCRNRGQGSRSAFKPGLRLQINHYDKDRTFLGLKTIILRNNTQDASMMHERVSFAFMRRMGLPTPRSAHTRLYVNGQYAGLYTITEEVDDVFTTRIFGNGSGYLYKYDYAPTDPPHLFEYLGSDPGMYVPKPFLPQSHEDDPQPGVIEAWWRTINQASDANFEQAVSEYVDLKNFLLEVGVEAYLSEQDGILGDFGLNNFLIYRLAGSNQFKFIPWDKSQTFFAIDRLVYQNVTSNIMMRRLLGISTMNAAFVDVILKSVASAGAAGGWLEQEMSKEYNLIRTAALEDQYKQCYGGGQSTRPCSNEEFEAEVAYMMRFARERGAYVIRELSSALNGLPGTQPFSVEDRGVSSVTTSGGTDAAAIGYARVQPLQGRTAPAALSIFGFRQNGILLSEAAVPAVMPIRRGRTFVQISPTIKTGVAIANPNAQAAQISFYFTDATGMEFGHGSTTIPSGGQITSRLNDEPFRGSAAAATFSFTSSVPVGMIALRGFTNERSEFLMSTQPVVDLDNPETPQLLPLFASGGGWTTSVILVNPYDEPLTVSVMFVPGATQGPFTIPARSSRSLSPVSGPEVLTGRVHIVPGGIRAPSVFEVVSFKPSSVTVSEASVLPSPFASDFRLYVERNGPAIESGVSIVNGAAASNITFEVTSLNGQSLAKTTVAFSPGQRSFFLRDLAGFQPLPAQFQGVLRISATADIAVAALRGRINERGDFLITTTPVITETTKPATEELIIPELVDGGGYTTQIILYGAYPGESPAGLLQFFTQNGTTFSPRLVP
jgi:spore coat protein CotH